MLFRVVDHYNLELQEEFEPGECIICLEVEAPYELIPIKLQSQTLYTLKCSCDGWIHTNCLNIWYNYTKSCPICRIHMSSSSLAVTLIKYVTYVINFISLTFYICLKFKWSLFLFLVTYYVYCLVLANIYEPPKLTSDMCLF